MLRISILSDELYDEESSEFLRHEEFSLEFEHSLVSLSKWESIHEKPFLGKDEKRDEEVYDYIRCMLLTENPPEGWVDRLTQANIDAITTYIDSKQSATFFSDRGQTKTSREIITSELIYYWMITMQIPMECQEWHLNRLFTLIKIFSVKNEKPKKMGRAEAAAQRRQLNAERKAMLGTTG